MRHHGFFFAMLVLLCAAPFALAQGEGSSEPAAGGTTTQSVVDREFDVLRAGFSNLYRSLSNNRGIADEDRPAIQAFLQRVRAFSDVHPEHPGGVAMQIQLLRWLGEEGSIPVLYAKLTQLDPGNVQVALAWLKYREQAEEIAGVELLEAYRELRDRFGAHSGVVVGWGGLAKNEAQYGEVVEFIEAVDFDASESPEVINLLAKCLFAEDRYEEAVAALKSIPAVALAGNRDLSSSVRKDLAQYELYVELWAKEQELRQAEAAAGDLPMVEIHTSQGRIVVELFEDHAPNTVANFVKLAGDGFYNGTKFHRFMADFMVQGGDPNSMAEGLGTVGNGGPGYRIPDEHFREDRRRHFRGTLAMANKGGPNTAGSQFYITHRATPWLNDTKTVFGRVVEGLDIARSLRKDDDIKVTIVLRKRDHEYVPETIQTDFSQESE